MTEEGRKRISEAQRKRWARKHQLQSSTQHSASPLINESVAVQRALEIFRTPGPTRDRMISLLKPIMLDLLEKQKAEVEQL